MPVLDVIHNATGERVSVTAEELREHPDAYTPVSGMATVETTSGGQVFALPTEELLAGRAGVQAVGAEREAERARAARSEALYGGVEQGVRQFARGAAAGLTGGLSEQFIERGASEAELEEAREARSVQAPAFTVGQLGTEVALGVLSGGTSLEAGAARRGAARLAEMTPVGALSRRTGRMISEGGIGAGVAAGAAEGLYGSASSVLADMALQDEPIATDALVAQLGAGLLVGGAVGGLGGALKKVGGGRPAVVEGGETLASQLSGAAEMRGSRQLAAMGDEAAGLAAMGSAGGRRLKYEQFFTKGRRTAEATGEAFGEVLRVVDDAAARRTMATQDLRRLVGEGGMLDQLPEAERAELRASLGVAIEQHAAATNQARRWVRSVVKDAPADAIARGRLPPLAGDEAAAGVDVLARLDETTAALDTAMRRAQRRVEAVEGFTAPPMLQAEVTAPGGPSRWELWGARVADAGAAIEGLQAVGLGGGLPDIEQIPVLGPILGTYLKFRALSRIVGRAGGTVPATPKAAAAARAVALRERILDVAEAAARRAPAAVPVLSLGAGKAGAALIDDARTSAAAAVETGQNLSGVRARALAGLVGVPAEQRETVAARAQEQARYLAETAPKPPFAGSAWAPKGWSPSPMQAQEWQERVHAWRDPGAVLEALALGAARPVAAEAVRALYPDLWQAQRQALLERLPDIGENMPRMRRVTLGQTFELPFDDSQVPGYPPAAAGGEPTGEVAATSGADFRGGSVPGTSATARLAMTAQERRMAGR